MSVCECVFVLQVTCEPVLPDKLFETEEDQETDQQLMEGAMREGEEEEDEREGVQEVGGERGGEEGEVKPSGSGVKGSRCTGSGLSSLLQVSENSTQNHSSLKLDLDVPWPSLVSPLPDENPPPSFASWYSSQTPGLHDEEGKKDRSLSLADYLLICRQHLLMSECDLQFSRAVYEVVEQQGERGVRLGDLREDDTLRSLPHSLSLDDHIQCLLNFEMVGRTS